MNLNRVVPFLSRINSCEGTREKSQLLYVTKGGKKFVLNFHFKENGKFYQYRAKFVYKTSILLMCTFKRNARSNDCMAFVTVTPNLEGLIKLGEQNN
jgi:hypothetical protein